MPGSLEEKAAFVRRLIAMEVMPDDIAGWEDGTTATEEEMAEVWQLVRYTFTRFMADRRKMLRGKPQRRAMKLLRRFLTADQQRRLTCSREFTVDAPSGRSYRFMPFLGRVEEVTRNGSRYFRSNAFCIHPEGSEWELPPADVAVAQLLHLTADEEDFRATANIRNVRDQLWNGEWRRTLARAQREREAVAAAMLSNADSETCTGGAS